MGKRRKTRTHKLQSDPTAAARGGAGATPKTFVVKTGHVGTGVSSLIGDMRRLLEPNTASRLKERKRNRLRDYVAMSGPLGVSHLLVFSQTETTTAASLSNVNLRLSRMPRGPTLSFKVLRYALMKDVLAATKHAHSPGREYATEPLLILNNFGGEEKQLKLMATVFQNLFPSIHVQTMPLTSARRVVLISYNATTRTIDLRHYLISIRPIGISKPIRKIIEGSSHSRAASATPSASTVAKGVPDLSRASDISEYVLHHADLGYASSASEGESDAEGAGPSTKRVELPGGYIGRANRRPTQGEQRAVRLVELGPRMELGLVKIEDGLGGNEGEIVFHEYLSKTNKEKAELAKKRREREARRKYQEGRVKAKAEAAEKLKADKGKGKQVAEDADVAEAEEEAIEEVAAEEDEEEEDFAYEDLFDEGADDVAQADMLDQVLDGDGDADTESDEEDRAARPTKNPRLAGGRDAKQPKYVMRGRGR